MSRTLLLNVEDPEERRAALVEDGRLSLLWVERADEASLVGNVYKGRVSRVEPSIGAAFVDVGAERPAFLHADDVMPALGEDEAELLDVSPRAPVGEGPPITELLSEGAEVVVQVTRDATGRKGPTVTTHVSLAGRLLVLMPSLGRRAVSRKITDPAERERLQQALDALAVPPELGLVARTAAEGAASEVLAAEAADLLEAHRALGEAAHARAAPCLLHAESDFTTRAIRELLVRAPEGAGGPTRIVVDAPEALEAARRALPEGAGAPEIVLHPTEVPLFHSHGIERVVRALDEPHVQLPGGAFLVIHATEALWAIDVNSGRFRSEESLEQTALEVDLLAAAETARQIRLRDLAGLIVVDFIDCREPENRARVEERFREELARDPARMRVAPLSEFMVAEVTRRRLRTGPGRIGSRPCPACGGRGSLRGPGAAGLAALRDVRALLAHGAPQGVEVACAPPVAEDLRRRKARLRELEERHGVPVTVHEDESAESDFFHVRRRA